MEANLLTRDEFRKQVFERDAHKCVICGEHAVDAHHIIDRSLFSDGGYYLDNGASLCEEHHLDAERTLIDCDEIRAIIGIDNPILPEHFFTDVRYDKWGNIILPNGNKLRGEKFNEEPVLKMLTQGNQIQFFQKYIKYPRTFHLPWSHLIDDDKILTTDEHFHGKRVIVTLKMDGENTTMYNDFFHARSLDSNNHESRNWVKGIWGSIRHLIDEDMRICGENLYAKHTVPYNDLPSYFMVFSIWNDNVCMSWDETVEYCGILGVEHVPVIYDGIYDAELIKELFKQYEEKNEGYVVRLADEYYFTNFRHSIAKYVKPIFREKLKSSDNVHWASKKIEVNGLKKNETTRS